VGSKGLGRKGKRGLVCYLRVLKLQSPESQKWGKKKRAQTSVVDKNFTSKRESRSPPRHTWGKLGKGLNREKKKDEAEAISSLVLGPGKKVSARYTPLWQREGPIGDPREANAPLVKSRDLQHNADNWGS